MHGYLKSRHMWAMDPSRGINTGLSASGVIGRRPWRMSKSGEIDLWWQYKFVFNSHAGKTSKVAISRMILCFPALYPWMLQTQHILCNDLLQICNVTICSTISWVEADRVSFSFYFSAPENAFLFFGVLFFGRKRHPHFRFIFFFLVLKWP